MRRLGLALTFNTSATSRIIQLLSLLRDRNDNLITDRNDRIIKSKKFRARPFGYMLLNEASSGYLVTLETDGVALKLIEVL